ncbi:MAG: imidazolonepropionase [Saprospiraceae bacterium]|nr:imidazolonepropionase [Saprospiraceae bacterium]
MKARSILIRNINTLVQVESSDVTNFRKGQQMKELPCLKDAYLLIENERIAAFGPNEEAPANIGAVIDAEGGWLMPCFVDSHTHLVFAEWRNQEFEDRIKGLTYQEIAARGGGILNSARKLRELSESELYERSLKRMIQAIQCGTGAFEIKSGYGLDTASELKILRVIQRLKDEINIPIKASFLGAHAFPQEYKNDHQAYIKIIIEDMLPRIADEGLADYCDVFCEKGFYATNEADQILSAALKLGLEARIHTNQFTHSGGIALGLKHHAASVDHLEVCNDEEIELLMNSDTHPILLPFAAFFMNLEYPPARKMIDRGLGIILASDFNPGTAPNYDLTTIWGIACNQMKMLPEEALNALTINPAINLKLNRELGSIAVGKLANLILTKPASALSYFPYAWNHSWFSRIFIRGNPDFLA